MPMSPPDNLPRPPVNKIDPPALLELALVRSIKPPSTIPPPALTTIEPAFPSLEPEEIVTPPVSPLEVSEVLIVTAPDVPVPLGEPDDSVTDPLDPELELAITTLPLLPLLLLPLTI
ncbi:hypothetical protein PC114_g28131 [Phytophthora cactorum]|nr:hypothetical protein PC114_g28131 [Phytophthora cactorum]KAG2959244.1 hypothetical protein PC120_g28177 [Phytophthora cactorum]